MASKEQCQFVQWARLSWDMPFPGWLWIEMEETGARSELHDENDDGSAMFIPEMKLDAIGDYFTEDDE